MWKWRTQIAVKISHTVCSTIYSSVSYVGFFIAAQEETGFYEGGKYAGKQFHCYSKQDVGFRKHIPQSLKWKWQHEAPLTQLTAAFNTRISRTVHLDVIFYRLLYLLFYFLLLVYDGCITWPDQYPIRLCDPCMDHNPMGETYRMADNSQL